MPDSRMPNRSHQKVVSLVRRSWGIDGRSDLLDMIRYLAQEGYILRYQLYGEASSPEELMDETMDEDDRASACRAWRFIRRLSASMRKKDERCRGVPGIFRS